MSWKMRNTLDGSYTRILRAVLEISWKDHKTKDELHGNLPKITDTLKIRRLRFVGHCWGRKDELISELLLWQPKHGARNRGIPAATYIDQLRNDTGLSIAELKSLMGNWREWMKLVNGARVRSKCLYYDDNSNNNSSNDLSLHDYNNTALQKRKSAIITVIWLSG